jgi:hypothetical protein
MPIFYVCAFVARIGLNTLFFELCTAPFVLTLEEDWMYMDSTMAPQVRGYTSACAVRVFCKGFGVCRLHSFHLCL